ncbi:MAG: type II secretion system F family protein [Candidatus Marinimicrobia bacterium]|jgi:type IV pilus assembly protein PilC|nr:type II secretion system F family protein [Candidatus Neomarinimicrobiota bacterium]MBT3634068.1 type II secretion system F family protein [Candidatus Neomarinimicrobiota bacterium]MBT3683058.1 type II secretion system F family protein [Candidatus Neomarinimicrobiota bacterium]MBT3759850.1 type II secretion system F family protein [Candidatus Neomarinimicrobiota bacterium]MBT3895697.1 type II secretion system F family protein [Candidatus Neomarinimicrobiota bacterium]
MALFTYLIRNAEGNRTEGEIEATNIIEAGDLIRGEDDNITIVKLEEKDTSFDFMGPFLQRLNKKLTRYKHKVPLNSMVFFIRQLATMFTAGLTIERAMHFLSKEEKNKRLSKTLSETEMDIRRGLLLSDALERHPGVFSNLIISLVRAGEVSGKLTSTLEELAIYMEYQADTQRKVVSALFYPVIILITLFGALLFMFLKIIPQFADVYDSLGAELPMFTIMIINLSAWIQTNVFSILSFTFLFFVVAWLLAMTDTIRFLLDKFYLMVPVFGNLIRLNVLARFAKTLGILLNAGVSVLESFNLISKVVENRVYELALKHAAADIENGINISRALKDTEVFPPTIIQLISTGEETGEIDQLALKAADFYTKQVNAIVDRITSIIEPILLILVGAIILVILLATYLPIFQIGEAF